MKTVLKDLKTGLLFRNMDEWTSDLAQAASFRDTVAALKFCQRANLTSVAIVHAYQNGAGNRIVGFHGRKANLPPLVPGSVPLQSAPTIKITIKDKQLTQAGETERA